MILLMPTLMCDVCSDPEEIQGFQYVFAASEEGAKEARSQFTAARMRKAVTQEGWSVGADGQTYCLRHSTAQGEGHGD